VSNYQPKHQASSKISSDFSTESNGSVENIGSSGAEPMQDVFSSTARQKQHEEQPLQQVEETLPETNPEQMESISSVSPEAVKKSKKKLVGKIALLFFSVAALLVGGVFIYAETQLNRINYVKDDSNASVAVASYITSAEVNSNTDVNLGNISMKNGLYHDDAIKNILIMGVDDYQKGDVGRSDSIMLVSVDTRHKKLKVTSFLRDLYLSIPGCSEQNRINVAYSIGRAPLTVQTIEGNFGIDIDNYVTVGYSSFAKIIDRLGGVTMTVTDGEAKLVNKWSGESKSKYLTEGTFLLTGKQALYYSRIRAIGDDFGRTERQRKVFNSIIDKFKDSNLGTINGILSDVLPLVTTNMDKNKVVDLATNSLTYMKYPTSQNRIPANNTFQFDDHVTIGGVPGNSVIVADMEKNSLIAAKYIYEDDFNFPSDGTGSSESTASK
jgi:LCP family protein required for cell wall assembly